jgi:gluconolactonase
MNYLPKWTIAALLVWIAPNLIASDLVADGAQPERLAGGFIFTEGPAADTEGNVYFTDIPNSRIHIWSHKDNKVSVFREQTGQANGLYFDKDGNLLACEGGNGRVTSTSKDGKVTVVADQYDGKRFNSPNDLWIDPKGGVYFTDPRYGREDDLPQDGKHVYYVLPDRSKVIRVTTDLTRPNGIIGTKDGKTLYVADHGSSKTYSYKIQDDGTLADKKEFAPSGSDGVTLDEKGNLYLTTEHVDIYDPSGKKIETITMPQVPANVTFGGPNRDMLFITARTAVFGVKMKVKGMY